MTETLYSIAQVNLYNNQIWCVASFHYFPTRFTAYGLLATAVTDLSRNYDSVVEATLE